MVEILVVLGIVTLLASVMMSVFFHVRAKGRQTVCASNLRQIGLAVVMYAGDYDGLYPRGGDPVDIHTDLWLDEFDGEFSEDAKSLRPLTLVMQPYVKNSQLWHCPADIGFDRSDELYGYLLDASPSSYAAFGTSYYYRTELTLRRKRDLIAYDWLPPHAEHGPSEINVMFDGAGKWHGANPDYNGRYNVLMADGRVKNMTWEQLSDAWDLLLELPKKPIESG